MVTAELAAVLPVVVLVLALSLTGLGLVIDQVRCVDAARVAARAASRGDPPEQVRQVAAQLAPEGSELQIDHTGTGSGSSVRVVVVAPGAGSWLPESIRPRAAVVAELEPGAADR